MNSQLLCCHSFGNTVTNRFCVFEYTLDPHICVLGMDSQFLYMDDLTLRY